MPPINWRLVFILAIVVIVGVVLYSVLTKPKVLIGTPPMESPLVPTVTTVPTMPVGPIGSGVGGPISTPLPLPLPPAQTAPIRNGTIYRSAINLGAPKTCQQEYPGVHAFWNIGDSSCWSCPAGFDRTVLFPITSDKACAKLEQNGMYSYSSATRGRIGMGPDGLTPINGYISYLGKYYKCPAGTGQGIRTGFPDTAQACSGTCPVLYGSQSAERGITGECYSCPVGYSYSSALHQCNRR